MEDLDSDEVDSCLEKFRTQDADREAFLKVATLSLSFHLLAKSYLACYPREQTTQGVSAINNPGLCRSVTK